MEIRIETLRMIIRKMEFADAAGMFEMDSDPEVKWFLGKKNVHTIDESIELIRFIRQQYIDNGLGRWAIIDRHSGEFMGWTGFRLTKETINGHTNYYDFGYRLKRKYWGQGFATEAARAALSFGIVEMGLKEIYALTDIDNLASRRILEKIGFIYTGVFAYDGAPTWRTAGQETTWYRLDSQMTTRQIT